MSSLITYLEYTYLKLEKVLRECNTHMILLDVRPSTFTCWDHFTTDNLNGPSSSSVSGSHVTIWNKLQATEYSNIK